MSDSPQTTPQGLTEGHPASASEPEPGGKRSIAVQCCVVGGGPAGMMLGYLLGRAGIKTIVLEKHADFFRDFRGDTVHPSTMKVMQELGLLEDFLKLAHQNASKLEGVFGATSVRLADMSQLNTPCPYIAFMPQWDLLNFIDDKGKKFPSLEVRKRTEAIGLMQDAGRVTGVVARTESGTLEIKADLVVACDGRHSVMREQAAMQIQTIGAPIDVLWFKVGKPHGSADGIFARVQAGQFMITLDREDYWQCAYVIGKGRFDELKSRGLDAFKTRVAAMAPILRAHIDDVKSWDDVKLLSVQIDRLTQWARPGFLCIGDAAHAMSPVGGVGINLAVQDAVATANLLYNKFGTGGPALDDLNRIQERRMFAVKATQAVQVFVQNNLINRAISDAQFSPPLPLRLVDKLPFLQGLTARLIGLGVRPEHVQSAEAKPAG